MKFTCEKALLQSAVSTVFRTASAKNAIPALEGILIEAGVDVSFTGYNLQTGIRTTVPADVSRTGSVVIDARLLSEIIRKLPDEVVSLSVNGDLMVDIRCGVVQFNILGMDPSDYPDLPEVDGSAGIDLPENMLRAMIIGTVFSVSESEARPVHTGVLFDIKGENLTLVAVDGYRMALRREKIQNKVGQDQKFVVPGASLRELEKIIGAEEKQVTVIPGSRHILFKTENTFLISRLLEGEFLNYEKSIPTGNPINIFAATKDFLQCVDRVSLIINESVKSPVRMVIGDDQVNFSCSTALGSVTDSCQVVGSGGELEIGFNSRYMMDALKAVPDEEIKLALSGAAAPVLILPKAGEERYLYMVLPVRLKRG